MFLLDACGYALEFTAFADPTRHFASWKEHRRLSCDAQRAGEQSEPGATMFFLDPCGNALEFKAFADPARLFAK